MARDESATRPIEHLRDLVRQSAPLRQGAHWLLARIPALRLAVQRSLAAAEDAAYREWVATHDTLTESDRAAIAARLVALPPTKISVVMPVFDPPEAWFRSAIASVRDQIWPHWELCIADDASTATHVARVLNEICVDPRIKIVRRLQNGHISAASNSALALATGEFVALMDHDDILPAHALYRVAEEIAAHPDAALIYSDEDQLDARGRRCQPAFKPDFDPTFLLSRNFVSHLGVYRRDLVAEAGGFREGFEGSQDFDLVLRVAECAGRARIRHIPAVLYHWRQAGSGNFSARALARCADASRRAVTEHLLRTGIDGEAAPHPLVPAAVRVRRRVPRPQPMVSVIMPTRDRADLLSRSADGVLSDTDYDALELLIIDNASRDTATLNLLDRLATDTRVRVLRRDETFNFSMLCNAGAQAARGNILVLLNNDVEMSDTAWLMSLVEHAIRPDVGAVGAKLAYPDLSVQHAGLLLGAGPDGIAVHAFSRAARDAPGPGGALWLEREVGAVTAACLAIRRAVYLEVGGMDEQLPVAYNDVDLCLRLRAAGYAIVWTPFAELVHHESATRGPDGDAARAAAAVKLRARWGEQLARDPFYNDNLSMADFFRPGAPRTAPPWRHVNV